MIGIIYERRLRRTGVPFESGPDIHADYYCPSSPQPLQQSSHLYHNPLFYSYNIG